MIDHMSLAVRDYAASKAFYVAALAPLHLSVLQEIPAAVTGDVDAAGFGAASISDTGNTGDAEFWITGDGPTTPHLHIAFRVATPEMVDGFYQAALAAGGHDNGAPGIRSIYHPNYYAAFVFDLDGHNIEAVCFLKE